MDDHHDKHKLKVISKIGHGAFGKVFKGTYDGAQCAVKTIANDDGPQAEQAAFKMFAREAQMLQECNHGRIIGFQALCRLNTDKHDGKKHTSGGKWALVLEYAKGGTLQEKVSACMISGGKVYTNAQALSWALDVASALEYLHAKSPAVLHRDVKLSNILLAAEEGQLVAKLSDFGLHVVAGEKLNRLLRVSFTSPNGQAGHYYTAPYKRPASDPGGTLASAAEASCTAAGGDDDSAYVTCNGPESTRTAGSSAASSANGSADGRSAQSSNSCQQLTQQHLQALQQQLGQGGVATAGALQQLRQLMDDAAGTSGRAGHTVDHNYGEMHDSSGSVGCFVGAQPASAAAATAGQGGGAVRMRRGPGRSVSFNGGSSAAAGAGPAGQQRRGPKRSVSFRNESASHPGDANHTQAAGGVLSDTTAAAGAAGSAAAYPPGYSAWGVPSTLYRDDSSMCSMVTDGTWVTDGTDGTGLGGDGSDDASCTTQEETVFNMTGQTGSFMYMSPEVFLRQPYNEKADVFSFGVVLYELLARVLLIFTELPTNTSDPAVTEWYAQKVAGGYRPAKPKRMPDGVWRIIEACWQQEPCCRPSVSQVVIDLQQLLRDEGAGPSSRRSSFSVGKASSTKDQPISGGDSSNGGPAVTAAGPTALGGGGGAAAAAANLSGPAPPTSGCACVIC